MDFQATKLELMQMLLNTEKEGVLLQLKEVFERNEKAQKEMAESAKRANSDIKAGRIHTPEEVETLLDKRFGS